MVAGWHPWLIEIAAGIIEPGETPAEVAVRETAEETGLRDPLEFIAHVLCTPGGSSETLALYCGQVDAAAAPTQGGLAHENEDIRCSPSPQTRRGPARFRNRRQRQHPDDPAMVRP
jgi:ADP-ribose pyrophosphatase